MITKRGWIISITVLCIVAIVAYLAYYPKRCSGKSLYYALAYGLENDTIQVLINNRQVLKKVIEEPFVASSDNQQLLGKYCTKDTITNIRIITSGVRNFYFKNDTAFRVNNLEVKGIEISTGGVHDGKISVFFDYYEGGLELYPGRRGIGGEG